MGKKERKNSTDLLFIEFVNAASRGEIPGRVSFEAWKRKRESDHEWEKLVKKTTSKDPLTDSEWQQLIAHISQDGE